MQQAGGDWQEMWAYTVTVDLCWNPSIQVMDKKQHI